MYRTIRCEFWTDEKVRALPALETLLFFYLITNTHSHYSGLYPISKLIMAHESKVKSALERTLGHLADQHLVAYMEPCEQVWVVNMFDHQGRGRKLDCGVAYHLKTLHRSPLIPAFLNRYPHVKAYCDDTLLIPNRSPIEGGSTFYSPDPVLLINPPSSDLKSTKHSRSNGKRAFPDDFAPSEKHRHLAEEWHLDLGFQLGKFKNYCLSHDKRYANYEATFRNWLAEAYERKDKAHAR